MTLARIHELLAEAAELAKKEPALRESDRLHLGAAKVGVRQALQLAAAKNANPDPNAFPKIAPEFYKDRADKNEGPIEFIVRVYGRWLNNADISQADIFNLDEAGDANGSKRTLELACYRLGNPREALDAIGLQTKKQKIDRLLAQGRGVKASLKYRRRTELDDTQRDEARLYAARSHRRRVRGNTKVKAP